MAPKIGKFKVTNEEYRRHISKLDNSGGNISGHLSIEGHLDLGSTLSGSGGSFIFPGDLNFATVNGDDRTTILRTTGIGSTLGIYDNLIYIDGENIGIGTVTPQVKLQIGNSGGVNKEFRIEGDISASGDVIRFNGLPTIDPKVSGNLFTTGSTTMGLGNVTGSGTFHVLCVSKG